MVEKVKIAFVGAGYMASEHAKAFGRLAGVELAGICSRTRARAEKFAEVYPSMAVFDSIREMYEETRAHLVVVCVRELDLLEVCRQSFDHPWVHLVEKPLGHDLAEARNIHRMSLETKARVFAAFNRRFYSSASRALSLLEEDDSSRMVTIMDQEDPLLALAAGQPEAVVLNWMFANSIHLIDLFNVFCRGMPKSVRPLFPWQGLATEFVAGELTFDSGDVGIYQAVWNRPGPWSLTVSTKGKRLEMRPLEKLTEQVAGSRVPREIETDLIDKEYKPGLGRMAESAVAALRGQVNLLPTIEDSLRSMELVAALYGKGD